MGSGQVKPIYPEMKLYEEIIFLQHISKLKGDFGFRGKYVVENVISYYEPLIVPQKTGLHYFWANFIIRDFVTKTRNHYGSKKSLEQSKGFNLDKYSDVNKVKLLRNCTESELGKHILDLAINPIELNTKLF